MDLPREEGCRGFPKRRGLPWISQDSGFGVDFFNIGVVVDLVKMAAVSDFTQRGLWKLRILQEGCWGYNRRDGSGS